MVLEAAKSSEILTEKMRNLVLQMTLDKRKYEQYQSDLVLIHGIEIAYEENILSISLRSGDVISRFSMTQFIVLLPTCNYDTGIMVMNRINENFHIYDPTCKVKLLCEVKELELS